MIYDRIMRKARATIKNADRVIDDMCPTYGQTEIIGTRNGKPVKVIEINGAITGDSCMVSNAVTVWLKNGDKLVYIAKEGKQE